jgi:hypothetical protein
MAKRQPVKPVGLTAPEAVKKVGRPTDFNEHIANRICELISESEKGIHKLYAENKDWMPVPSTIMLWLSQNQRFSEQYTQAKRLQADKMGENILDIADDSSGDSIETSKGVVENREFTSRSKLRVETRMWLMERLDPKKYGKLSQEADPANNQAESYQPPQITVNISKEAIDKLNK